VLEETGKGEGPEMGKLLLSVTAVVVALVSVPSSASAGEEGYFNAPCRFSHRLADDPIVFPGKPGASHSHDFLGNSSTNSRSTPGSLRASPGLCSNAADKSAWWVPTLYENGIAIAPETASTYYRTGGRDGSTIEPFPFGLRVIAGNAHATGPQDEDLVRWECSEDSDMVLPDPTTRFFRRQARRRKTMRRLDRSIARQRRAGHARKLGRLRARRRALRMNPVLRGGLPLCPPGEVVNLSIEFPECWDGKRLDSPDHQAHMTFSVQRGEGPRTCPASHPRAVPDVQLHLRYPTRGGPAVQLASGLEYTAHADFFNAWDPGGLADLVRGCLNAGVGCG
jgi:Domain of unknown function (DUF1996)